MRPSSASISLSLSVLSVAWVACSVDVDGLGPGSVATNPGGRGGRELGNVATGGQAGLAEGEEPAADDGGTSGTRDHQPGDGDEDIGTGGAGPTRDGAAGTDVQGGAGAGGVGGTAGTVAGIGGASAKAGAGGNPSAGPGGNPSAGAGGNPSAGAGGTSAAGAGGTPPAGTGGSSGQAGGCVAAPVRSYCEELPVLNAQPVLDGVVECQLALEPVTPVGWTGSSAIPAGRSARWAAAHRSSGLYLYVDVTTPEIRPSAEPRLSHCGDAVELFVDADGRYGKAPSYDDPGTTQFVVQAPSQVEAQAGWRWRGGLSLGQWGGEYRSFKRPGGYVVEAFVHPQDLNLSSWPIASGGRVGLTIAVDLAGPPPYREPGCMRAGSFTLRLAPNGDCREPWCNVGAFCTPMLR